MRKSCLLLALAIFGLTSITNLRAEGIDPSFLKYVTVLPQGGLTLNTYEDVAGVRFVAPSVRGPNISVIQPSKIQAGYVSEDYAKGIFAQMYPNALVSDEYPDANSLVAAKFYLDFGYMGADGEWVPHAIGKGYAELGPTLSFPHGLPAGDSNKPRSQRYYHCMYDGYQYVTEDVDYPPDALSCDTHQYHLCPSRCKKTKSDPNTQIILKGRNSPESEYSHIRGTYNIYENFRSNVITKAELKDATPITGKTSGVYTQVLFKDRTPPWVLNCTEEKRFPAIGEKDKSITTGDLCYCNQLELTENRSSNCTVKLSYGKIDLVPQSGNDWTAPEIEEWVDSEKQEVNLSGDTGKIDMLFTPNTNYGYMRYTVFAMDEDTHENDGEDVVRGGNINPGCASIVEDNPTECYGLPEGENLKDTVNSPKPWPYSPDGSKSSLTFDKITGDDRVKGQEGLIRITDNDLPNILIRLTSTKDNQAIFFPPFHPATSLSSNKFEIINSPNYSGVYGSQNNQEYISFISQNSFPECDYESVKNSCSQPFYKLLKLEASEWANSSDVSLASQLVNGAPELINKTFKLENHSHSDNDFSTGNPETINTNGEAGDRNGTWKNCVAFIDSTISPNIKIQEDVEYKLDIWTDDSVKWRNADHFENTSPEDTRAIAIPTGIDYGIVTLNIPNQYPPIENKTFSFNNNKSVNEYKVVFREPTANVTINSEEDLVNNKFPNIEVKVRDYAGNERRIKLYFSVLDENASIRTLQRKHDQH